VGPYCNYCNKRCFLLRKVPTGRVILLATCPQGMAHDRTTLKGHDHRTTLNPTTGTVDLKVRIVAVLVDRPCEHPGCPWDGRIPAGERFARITQHADSHAYSKARRLHLTCLADLYQLTEEVAA
jgi:hypothetical protein